MTAKLAVPLNIGSYQLSKLTKVNNQKVTTDLNIGPKEILLT